MTRAGSTGVLRSTVLLLVIAVGCAADGTEPYDPYEPFNRKVFAFNEGFDEYVLAPVAWVWDAVLPDGVQFAIVKFVRNLDTPLNSLNQLLQGQFAHSGTELGRFAINTTVGLLGFFDPATHWGIEAHRTDFGYTLAAWGVPSGPYLVLPFLGPATARSTAGLGADIPLTVKLYHDAYGLPVTPVTAVDTVNRRAYYDKDIANAKAAAFDYYTFRRSVYLQQRGVLHDDDEDEYEFFDETPEVELQGE